MNRMFRIIWSRALHAWVVASELTGQRGNGGNSDRCRTVVAGVSAGALVSICWASPAGAQVWKGTSSSDWTVGSNWSTGAVPTSAGTVTINTNSPNPTVLGFSGPATATIGTLYMSGVAAGTPNTFTSALTIQNGSTLSSGAANIGYWDAGASVTGSAAATVTGQGSSWSATSMALGTGSTSGLTGTSAPGTLNIADGATVKVTGAMTFGPSSGSGTLNITGGGTLTTGNATMWDLGASTVNTANISGAGSKWSVAGTLVVGYRSSGTAGTSTLNVANGGAVVATGDINLGGTTLSTGGVGIVTVTGAGSQLSTSGALNIGFWGKGSTLTVSDGAVATASTVAMTAGATSTAMLDLSSGGTLATQSLTAGGGAAQANFDGGTLRATASNTAFISGFTGTALNIATGGLTLDTGAFNVTAASPFSGTGALTKIGTGTAVFSGNSTYTGGTTISAGALQLGNGGTSGSIVGNVTNNGTLAFDRSDSVTYGGTISGSGSVGQIGAGTTVLTGNSTYTGGTTISAGALQLGNGGTSGSIVGNVTNNGTLAFDRSDTVSYGGTISGSGSVGQIGAGTTVLTGNSTYTGTTTIAAGALAVGDASHPQATSGSGDVSVASGAALGGYGRIAGSVQNVGVLAPANALPIFASGSTGTLRIGGSLTNSGTLQLAAANGRPGNVLEVSGNYSGGGQLILNTLLNEGGAASQTDRLVVRGQASGQTAIAIRASGVGAKTVGDGILVVELGQQSSANSGQQTASAQGRMVQRQLDQGVQSASGSFQLAGPVQGGAYQYLLYQGGTQSAQDWYLRSTVQDASVPGASTPGVPAPVQAGQPDALYRPAVTGYALMPALNVDYGFSVLGRLHERVGDVAALEAVQGRHGDSVWGRVGGNGLDASAGRFAADSRAYFAQLGKDWTLRSDASSGSTHVGVTATIGSMSASFDDRLRSMVGLSTQTGTAEMQAQSLGGYLTRYFAGSGYVDAVAQLTHYRNRYGDVYRGNGVQNGYGAGLSLEAGQPFAVAGLFAIEPQMQLMYQYMHLNRFDDTVSSVSGNTTHALRGRAGIRVFKANMANASGTSAATPYLTADVLHDFTPMGTTSVAGTVVPGELGRTWYELGAGVSAQWGKSMQFTTQVKYANHLGGDARRNVAVQAGLRYGW
ncbi:autotransporter outer membrane beta-barrel domain-containing protein [Burkholderia ubonensis]|uniref:autotransporter outer membrane beta-barrel domain-containing protein n=1 Tax=Burkholderia ubonensis TaxID=101571 RepID=UPI0009B3DECA|nr:autotransporter outer membrane beta-barrel domain-containing protein [Burkholderia ubonensis]